MKRVADELKIDAEKLEAADGKIREIENPDKSVSWKEACKLLGATSITQQGQHTAGARTELTGSGVGGVQIADVSVDIETGIVTMNEFLAVQDCGLIINKLCCESQVAGAVIMGVNGALFEERVMDARTGRQCNPDMEFYKLGAIADMPNIVVHMYDMPERGVIGIGEPPAVSTIAAIGNAVFNAIGRRVAPAPFTPERVLAALAAK